MLDATDFTPVASGGFGDPHNGLAWSMEWFKGRLYVGTLRDLLWLFKKVGNYPYLDPYPVPMPPLAEMDLRAQIWRYTPGAESWERVYTSPLITPSLQRPAGPFLWRRLLGTPRILRMLRRQGRQRRATVLIRALLGFGLEWARAGFRMQVARDMGYRNMAIYTDRHETEALYMASFGAGSHLLRTTDGTAFEVVTNPSLKRNKACGFRPLVSFKGRLYGSPVGAYFSSYPVVLEADDPARGAVDPAVWRPVSTPGFGDPDNVSIAEMEVFQDHLYAGTGNLNGYQVWKTAATGSPPYRWQQVVADGGQKGPPGPFTVVSMYPFGEWLYVGSGRAPAALETLEPTPGELIRIAPDDTWEVVAGAPRETQQGFKAPVSGMPGGFGNPFAMYVWRMVAHQGWLYAGFNDATTILYYTPWNRVGPRAAHRIDQHGGVEKFLEAEGGFDLWCTQDGVDGTCVTRTGFGNPFNNGVRTFKSTPFGLFVGSQNFFTEAKDPVTGELRGGVDIWLGTP
jgi:hypothetical protein